MSNINKYEQKYLKYKNKYLQLKNQNMTGGGFFDFFRRGKATPEQINRILYDKELIEDKNNLIEKNFRKKLEKRIAKLISSNFDYLNSDEYKLFLPMSKIQNMFTKYIKEIVIDEKKRDELKKLLYLLFSRYIYKFNGILVSANKKDGLLSSYRGIQKNSVSSNEQKEKETTELLEKLYDLVKHIPEQIESFRKLDGVKEIEQKIIEEIKRIINEKITEEITTEEYEAIKQEYKEMKDELTDEDYTRIIKDQKDIKLKFKGDISEFKNHIYIFDDQYDLIKNIMFYIDYKEESQAVKDILIKIINKYNKKTDEEIKIIITNYLEYFYERLSYTLDETEALKNTTEFMKFAFKLKI